jgi:NADH-quinone oxidoreductase subunit E
MISESIRVRFDREVAKYPAEQRQSAVMACLAIIQDEQGHVSLESERELAAFLGMAPMAVHEGNEALAHLEAKLGIKMGETTPDGLFTLQQSECLGACADSPVMLVNDRHMCSFMSNQKLDQLIAGLKAAGANQ